MSFVPTNVSAWELRDPITEKHVYRRNCIFKTTCKLPIEFYLRKLGLKQRYGF